MFIVLFGLFLRIVSIKSAILTSTHFIVSTDIQTNWQGGRDYCSFNFNTDLASILNQDQQDEIKLMIEQMGGNTDFWIGANDIASETNFVWIDGQLIVETYENWGNNEPNNFGGNENCVQVGSSTQIWNDVMCST